MVDEKSTLESLKEGLKKDLTDEDEKRKKILDNSSQTFKNSPYIIHMEGCIKSRDRIINILEKQLVLVEEENGTIKEDMGE